MVCKDKSECETCKYEEMCRIIKETVEIMEKKGEDAKKRFSISDLYKD